MQAVDAELEAFEDVVGGEGAAAVGGNLIEGTRRDLFV